MAERPLRARVPPTPAGSTAGQLTLVQPGSPGQQGESSLAEGASRRTSIGVAAVAGRGCQCLVLMPENLAPEHAAVVRGYRRGVVAWAGPVPHFTAGTSSGDAAGNPRLHVLGDDPEQSVYAPGGKGQASLLEDFWPATFDRYRAQAAGDIPTDGEAVLPRASRPVWAALDVGVEVGPHDVVVVLLTEAAEPVGLEGERRHRPVPGGWPRTALRGAVGAVLGVAILLLGVITAVAVSPAFLGDSDRSSGAGTTARPTLTGFAAYGARVRGPDVAVYESPRGDSTLVRSFPAAGDYGAAQTFLVEREQRRPDGVWYQVLLPVRPNGTTGWVRAADVEVMGLPFSIKVHLRSLRLELFRDGRLERTFPIGIGTVETPTPPGRYYIKYLMRPDDQNTLYGHFVYGLSGYSDVVRDVPGGGELGIHGTNDPENSIGNRVSQGCIRLRNEDVASLVPLLPLGTPVQVVDDRAPKDRRGVRP